ncbi:aromatic/alkene monooxygenase hydroxylase subunit beta [Pseudonocardia asaccharolytica]|uniref:propane 2-monooxygenase n=1 Tax=Pseudonocardia asaccharolytica DSM 44247 = NBRC 16224 TaxID=1123024 RepID=A0A511CZP7_9PSEU|nr:aromatic/alkene monooxygenase hydroxylase subunit beta [Pseudonocardia asaccharolytica]GEL18016.1 toluene hydroxylase [Pseudonocardia asaccharolytica DSM 44247 = NBRC 16224]
MTTTERPERSVPKPVFTDAEAGAREFPDSDAKARRFNYFTPAKRKQSHYEDVTVEVQPDPRHYLAQGWIYGFANGETGYPLHWTKLKAWGVDKPEPVRGVGTGGLPKDFTWPAHGWHEFRDPNEEWEMTLYRYNANVVRQLNQNIENARNAKAFGQWTRNWVQFVERNVGAWMHVEHVLGLYVFAACNRSGPTNMHNTAMAVNSAHKIRFAQDLALYNLTLTEELDGFDGTAHLDAWNNDPVWQGVRKVAEALTAVQDDWGESVFAANVVFEPLLGELFRSNLVMQSAAGNGDFVTPTVMGAGEYDYAQRDLRWTIACFAPLTQDREFADHNKQLMQGWLAHWVPQCIEAARTLQPIWSQPDAKPPRFEDSLDRAKNRFAGILSDLHLETPKELSQ